MFGSIFVQLCNNVCMHNTMESELLWMRQYYELANGNLCSAKNHFKNGLKDRAEGPSGGVL